MNKPQLLPSGNYRIRITGPDGARHSVTDTTPRKVELAAKALLGQLHVEHQAKLTAKAAAKEARENPRKRFDLFAESWLHTRRPGEPYGYRPVVYRQRLNHLRTLNETFGHRYVQDITVADVRAWWNSRSGTPAHRSNMYWLLHSVFEVALDDELIQRNPCRVKGASRPAHRKRPTFTDEDVDKILAATADPQMLVILQVLAGTALRIGELLALDWEHVELLDRRVHVVRHLTPLGLLDGTKSGEYDTRSIALPLWVQEILQTWYITTGPEGPIFRNTRGTRLSIDSAERIFRPIRAAAGLDQMHLHDCRHVALTKYGQLPGVTLADIMRHAGHKSERVAMGYQHSSDERGAMHAANAVAPRWART
jgi:integrase